MIYAYVMWRIKEGIKIEKKDLTYFSPGGYTFTHKSGKHIVFDFMDSWGGYNDKDGILDFNHKNIDNELITDMLKQDNYKELIQEKYDIDFFRDGKIDLESSEDEMFCCMDLNIKGEIVSEVDFSKYVEPVYMGFFDGIDTDNQVVLLNRLTPTEYKKYFDVN